MLCELVQKASVTTCSKELDVEQKVQCALNTHMKEKIESKEKLCVNDTAVAADESIFSLKG